MKILIAGSHGMIGSAVASHLVNSGYQVTRLVRNNPNPGEVWWDPGAGEIDRPGLDGFDGVVHLATMPWPVRWTAKAKGHIRANRLATNRLLAETLAECEHRPQVVICASGMGYYPSCGDTVLTEDSPAGTSFLARLQQDSEAAAAPAVEAGIRVVHLRIPPVIGKPALQRGGLRVGNGQQWMSWVACEEMPFIIEFTLNTTGLTGPVNTVSPNPLRNAEFAATVSQALGRKSRLFMPAFLVRLLMGEMGEELILSSRRIQPARLVAVGYTFRFPELQAALHHLMQE